MSVIDKTVEKDISITKGLTKVLAKDIDIDR